jgi:hypothetical protein
MQTAPLNFEEIRKRLDGLKITREDRERLKQQEFGSDSDSDSDKSLSLMGPDQKEPYLWPVRG